MARHSLLFRDSVEKDLRRLPHTVRSRCMRRVDALCDDPRPRGAAKLVGSQDTYRLRVGMYRIVYQVDDKAYTVTVQYVRHRGDAYR